MKKITRILLTILGYLLYTIGVVVFLLWILFPRDSALVWLQRQLDTMEPSLAWKIKDLKPELPLSLKVSDISLFSRGDMENKLFHVAEMSFYPDIPGIMKFERQVPVRYRMQTLGGTIDGVLHFTGKDSDLQCTGKLKNLQLEGLEDIWRKTNRSGSGGLSGDFRFEGPLKALMQGDMQASLKVSNGKVSLQQQILGLDQVEFNTMSTDLEMKGGSINFENGIVDSRLFSGNYKGIVRMAKSLYASSISLTGFFEPRPELLGGLKNPAVSSLIKSQLQDGKLSFTISGTIMEPGIQFRGASGVIDGVLEGGMK